MENPFGLELEVSNSVNQIEAQAARTLSSRVQIRFLIGRLLLLKIPCAASSEKFYLLFLVLCTCISFLDKFTSFKLKLNKSS